MKDHLLFQIVSLPDREKVAAEIWLGDIQIAEINREKAEMEITLFLSKTNLNLPLKEFLNILEKVKKDLYEKDRN